MSAATKQTRPHPHTCCPNARLLLSTYSFAGSWCWKLSENVPVIFCPWCGVELPKTAKLEIVKERS